MHIHIDACTQYIRINTIHTYIYSCIHIHLYTFIYYIDIFWHTYTYMSCVPRQWKTTIIHPVPKVQNPSTPAEYRPISVVSILSRIVERIIVHSYIYPAFLKPPIVENIKDQFAFRPTGSTTAAVIDLLQQTTTML